MVTFHLANRQVSQRATRIRRTLYMSHFCSHSKLLIMRIHRITTVQNVCSALFLEQQRKKRERRAPIVTVLNEEDEDSSE